MAWIRQLNSGLWAATVYTPAGRITESHEVYSIICDWAKDLETDVRRGEFIDPRLSRVTVSEWWDRVHPGRAVEAASRRRDESQWRNHVRPYWKDWQLGAILKPDISTWVRKMSDPKRKPQPVGAATIHGSVSVLSVLLEEAVDARILRTNPCHRLRLPRIPTHVDRVLTWAEQDELLGRLEALHPGYAAAGLLAEMMLGTGGRWEEVAALRKGASVDLRRNRVRYGPVVEADGTIRPYGKTNDGDGRWVGLEDELAGRLARHLLTVPPGGLVFTAPKGGVLIYRNWHRRVWTPSLTTVVAAEPVPQPASKPGPKPKAVRLAPYLDDPQPTPHDLRHTFGSRLADAGMEESKISDLLGHGDGRSTKRYIHVADKRFDDQRQALARSRARERSEGHDSQGTHDLPRRSKRTGLG